MSLEFYCPRLSLLEHGVDLLQPLLCPFLSMSQLPGPSVDKAYSLVVVGSRLSLQEFFVSLGYKIALSGVKRFKWG